MFKEFEGNNLGVLKKCFLIMLFLTSFHLVDAQKLAIKTNLISDVVLAPNIGVELIASNNISVCLNGSVRPWDAPFDKMRFTMINPQLKYWFQRPLCRLYTGIDFLYIDNDIKIKDTGYKGDAKGIVLLVGYSWILSNQLNFEVGLGLGGLYVNQYKYKGEKGEFEPNQQKWLLSPTSCSVSFVYIIK